MGGSIQVTSEPGKGSTFWLELTLEKAPATTEPPPPSATLRGLRVLVVDDNTTNRFILRRQLQSWGARPCEARSGAEALEMLHQAADSEPFELVLLDMHMPDMDGAATARAIKRDLRFAELPLVLLSSARTQETAAGLPSWALRIQGPRSPQLRLPSGLRGAAATSWESTTSARCLLPLNQSRLSSLGPPRRSSALPAGP